MNLYRLIVAKKEVRLNEGHARSCGGRRKLRDGDAGEVDKDADRLNDRGARDDALVFALEENDGNVLSFHRVRFDLPEP